LLAGQQDDIVSNTEGPRSARHRQTRLCLWPGNEAITSRVGIGTFGIFLHLGGGNTIPLTFVDNCVEAIVLAALRPGVDGESSMWSTTICRRAVDSCDSVQAKRAILPIDLSAETDRIYLSALWESYSTWSKGQLPPAYNRRGWYANWKKTGYSNDKLKRRLGWAPVVSTADAFERYFQSCRERVRHA
jgi:nucleoside-diphosphate-sugar epimerase